MHHTRQANRDHNRTFNVRIVERYDSYGLDDALTHWDPAGLGTMVEFYDSRYTEGFGPLGQFVSRYYVSTLEEDAAHLSVVGLTLDAGVPDWHMSGEEFAEHWGWICDAVRSTES